MSATTPTMLARSKLCRFCPSPSAQAPQRLLSVQGRSSSLLPQLQMRLQEPIQGDTQCRINTVNIWDSRNIKRWKLDGWMKVSDTRMCDGMTALSAQSHRPVPTVILADGCDRRRTSLAVANGLYSGARTSSISSMLSSTSTPKHPSHSPHTSPPQPSTASSLGGAQPEARIDGRAKCRILQPSLRLVGRVLSVLERPSVYR
ncbi:hypothetical protein C8F01DRAFT_1367351 [Mycena amicta]|nr:hypothetical protein C8F01DRAFT_1367351 [Mycena amicta]